MRAANTQIMPKWVVVRITRLYNWGVLHHVGGD
jgi:hypothetical protein